MLGSRVENAQVYFVHSFSKQTFILSPLTMMPGGGSHSFYRLQTFSLALVFLEIFFVFPKSEVGIGCCQMFFLRLEKWS